MYYLLELIKKQQFKLPLDSVSLSLLRPTLLPCYVDKTLKETAVCDYIYNYTCIIIIVI